ncbi:MAG TPA: HAMP domain-containing sensor histidine kinase [Myxococcales bacterium]|nr:HAMP domain-containing sensor histidine kinase [Myxococcales bacterium]
MMSARPSWLIALMVLAVALVATLAWWDEQREASLALDEFAENQVSLAASAGAALRSRLDVAEHDALALAHPASAADAVIAHSYLHARARPATAKAPDVSSSATSVIISVPVPGDQVIDLETPTANLFFSLGRIERPGERVLLLLPPGASAFQTSDGRSAPAPQVAAALESGAASIRLGGDDAAALGLPARSAWAGLARVNHPLLGRWGIAVVTTALRDRDRAVRGKWRLLLSTLLAAGLVLLFGGLALRERARELEAQKSLALAQLGRERDERLHDQTRTNTVITLASGIAHEVATPLSVIVGRAEQLQARANGDERAGKALQTILDQTERIREVIRGFLGLARGTPLALASVPPRSVVAGAVDLVEHRFSKARVSMESQVDAGLPDVRCDQRLLEQALVNLLLNACDASRAGGHVQVQAARRNGNIEFSVTDHGEGISPAVAARATEPFFTTKGEGGTGLGLAIANEIVKTHRGTLSIEPQPQGTRVSFQIPLAPKDAEARA